MSDADLTLDFSDVEAKSGGFDPIPKGWYAVVVSDWNESEVGDKAKKLEPGTPGTTYELTVDEGDYENRKLWPNFWHEANSMKYWKQFLIASGAFTEEELNGALDINELRERPLGRRLLARVKIRPGKGEYEASNQVVDYAPEGSDVSKSTSSNSSGGDSLMP